jgi:single-strand DNA-binding protein
MGIARATLVGNLTSDPRLNDAGTVCNLRIAVNSRRKVGEEWQDVANYFDVVVIGNRAQPLAGILSKGKQIAVDAKIQWREYTDKDGNARQSVEFLADEVQLLGKKDDDAAPRDDAKDLF